MASCGISLNLSSLESKITAHISGALGIANLAGLPFTGAYLSAVLQIARGNFLGAIKIMVPSDALDGLWKGLRDEFSLSMMDAPMQWSDGSYVDAASDGTGFFSSIKKTASEWGSGLSKFASTTGLDQLSGFVDINVTDLAKSAIGLGGSFDSCDFGTSGIQNFFRDPSTGTIKLLANYAPKLGDTSVAAGNNVLGLALEINNSFQSGKFKNAFSLEVILGDVVSSGTNYALDSISGAVDIDPRDLNNIRQYLTDQTFDTSMPNSLQSLRRSPVSGQMELISTTTRLNDLKSKIGGFTSENDVMIKDKYPDFFSASVNF